MSPSYERSRAPKAALVAIVLCSAFASVVIAWKTPAWESNDEPDHVRNVETLVRGRWYRIEKNAGYSPHQPPLYYLMLAGWQKALRMKAELPHPQQGDAVVANGQFGHAQPREAHDHRRLLLLRLPSVVLGALTILFTARTARALGADPWMETAAAATVATIPKFVFSASFVNNDVLATTLGALATLLVVRLWRNNSVSRRLAIGLGLTCGALLETKLSAIPLVGVIGLAVIWRLRRAWRGVLAVAVPAALVSAPLFVSNQRRYGDPLAAKASIDYFRSWIPALVAVPRTFDWFGKTVASGAATSFWYTSGWNQFRWQAKTYVPLWALSVAGGLGNIVRRRPRIPGNGLLCALVLGAASSIWVLAYSTTQWQARVAFPGLTAFGALIALGWQKWRTPTWMAFMLPTLSAIGTLYAIKADVFGRY